MNANTTHDDSTQLTARQMRWQSLAEVVLIVLVFFVATGDVAPNVNESHYLCRLKHFWNPTWCTGDLFLDSADTQVLFIWFFGWVTKFVSLTATAWIGRVVAWTAIAWAWQRLSWRIVPRRFAAVLSAALFLAFNLYLHLAGEWVVGGVEAKCFAFALVLWALREMIDRRWNWCWLLLGCATAFHPLVGGWCGLLCAAIWLIDGRREQNLWSILPGLFSGGAIGLIGVVPALLLTWGVPAETVAEATRIYVFDRLPHHLAPLSMPAEEVRRRVFGHGALVLALCALTIILRRMRATNSQQERAPGRIPSSQYEAYRRIALFALGAVQIALVGFAIELALTNQPLLAAKMLRYYWFRTTDFATAMTVALQLTALIVLGLDARRAWAKPLLLASICFAGWFLGDKSWPRWPVRFPQANNEAVETRPWPPLPQIAFPNQIPPSDKKIVDYPGWVEVCDWIATNTPPNALFVTPRLNCTFKWRTGRPEVVNRKDIPQDAAGIVEWHDRLKDIYTTQFGGVDQSVDSVGALGTDRVRELAAKYHAQFVLSDRTQLLQLPVVYRNEEYVVYRIAN